MSNFRSHKLLYAIEPHSEPFRALAANSGLMQSLKGVVFSLIASEKKPEPDEIGDVDALAFSLPFFNAFQIDSESSMAKKIKDRIKDELSPPFREGSEMAKIMFEKDPALNHNTLRWEYFELTDRAIVSFSETALQKYFDRTEWFGFAPTSLFPDFESKLKLIRVLLFVIASVHDIGLETNKALLLFDIGWHEVDYPNYEDTLEEIEDDVKKVRDVSGELAVRTLRKEVERFASFSKNTAFPPELVRVLNFPRGEKLDLLDRTWLLKKVRIFAEAHAVETAYVQDLLNENAALFSPLDFVGKFNTLYIEAMRAALTTRFKISESFVGVLDHLKTYETQDAFIDLLDEGQKADLKISDGFPFIGTTKLLQRNWRSAFLSSSIWKEAVSKVSNSDRQRNLVFANAFRDKPESELENLFSQFIEDDVVIAVLKGNEDQIINKLKIMRIPESGKKIGIIHVRLQTRFLITTLTGVDVYVCPRRGDPNAFVTQYAFGVDRISEKQTQVFDEVASLVGVTRKARRKQHTGADIKSARTRNEYSLVPWVLQGALLGFTNPQLKALMELFDDPQNFRTYTDYVDYVYTLKFMQT